MVEDRDRDMEMLKYVLQHCAHEIYEATLHETGYSIAQNESFDGDTTNLIGAMKRAISLMERLYESNCSISELEKKDNV